VPLVERSPCRSVCRTAWGSSPAALFRDADMDSDRLGDRVLRGTDVRCDSGLSSVFQSPQLQDQSLVSIRARLDRLFGNAERAALVGRPSPASPQILRPGRGSPFADRADNLVGAYRVGVVRPISPGSAFAGFREVSGASLAGSLLHMDPRPVAGRVVLRAGRLEWRGV